VIDVNHPISNPVHASGADYAFLMESQWIARLPKVQEESKGAAPDELIVYYCYMFPFKRNSEDPTARLPREYVPDYVHTGLVPQMVEAFRVQTDDWGFPWHQAWTSYCSGAGEGAERLSVALSNDQTWFHSKRHARGMQGSRSESPVDLTRGTTR
jgi:hypothetical protein